MKQATDVIQSLKRSGILKRGRLQQDKFVSMSLTSLLDVLDEVAAATSQIPTGAQIAGKTHCASIGLSGAPSECAAFDCRMTRADELSRFAALYSDHVFFHNFLAASSPSFGHPPDKDTEDFRLKLFSDLAIFVYLRPLIESGILIPYSTPRVYCASCFAKFQIGDEAGKRVKKARRALNHMLLGAIDIKLDLFDGDIWAACSGNIPFFEHGSIHYNLDDDVLVTRPRLLSQLRENGSLNASKALTRDLGLHKGIVENTLHSAVYQMAVSELTGADFLSHRSVEVDILKRIACDDFMSTTNSIIAKNWTNMVPFVRDVTLHNLVKLRTREKHSFVQYRVALDEAVAAVVNEGETLSDRRARAVYSDILAPELGRLEKSVAEAKRDLVKTPIATALGTTAAIGVGIYSGMLAAELLAVAKALGLGKISYDTVKSMFLLGDVWKPIRKERFYFLWKVRHSASYRRH